MKKWTEVALVVILMGLFWSCSDDSSPNTNDDNDTIIGTWISKAPQVEGDQESVIELTFFEEDNYFTWKWTDHDWDSDLGVFTNEGTNYYDNPNNYYHLDEPYIELYYESRNRAFYYTVQDNNHRTFYYGNKFDGSGESIVGTWTRTWVNTEETPFNVKEEIIFTQDGKYTEKEYNDDVLNYTWGPYNYFIDGDEVTIMDTDENYNRRYKFGLQNNKLYLLYETFYMTRQ